jgi:hypothetical protein
MLISLPVWIMLKLHPYGYYLRLALLPHREF